MAFKKNLDLIVVIPVYNEEEVILKVVKQWVNVTQNINSKILIINDGSTDRSKKILEKIKIKKIKILNIKNSGHGRALLYGYKAAIKLRTSFIFQVDSDNQFSTKNFKKFWQNREKYDFQYGYRFDRKDPVYRLIITRILKFLIFFIFRASILDSNVPYRLMRANILNNFISKKNISKNVPNICISIYFCKYYKSNYYFIIHKERKTGNVFAIRLKLLKFCIESFFELLKFRVNLKKI